MLSMSGITPIAPNPSLPTVHRVERESEKKQDNRKPQTKRDLPAEFIPSQDDQSIQHIDEIV